jgi:hypothetical protein
LALHSIIFFGGFGVWVGGGGGGGGGEMGG